MVLTRHEAQDRNEGDGRGVEGYGPDAEDLVDGDVEDQVGGIISYCGPPPQCI